MMLVYVSPRQLILTKLSTHDSYLSADAKHNAHLQIALLMCTTQNYKNNYWINFWMESMVAETSGYLCFLPEKCQQNTVDPKNIRKKISMSSEELLSKLLNGSSAGVLFRSYWFPCASYINQNWIINWHYVGHSIWTLIVVNFSKETLVLMSCSVSLYWSACCEYGFKFHKWHVDITCI